jgi:hypothetical protein
VYGEIINEVKLWEVVSAFDRLPAERDKQADIKKTPSLEKEGVG